MRLIQNERRIILVFTDMTTSCCRFFVNLCVDLSGQLLFTSQLIFYHKHLNRYMPRDSSTFKVQFYSLFTPFALAKKTDYFTRIIDGDSLTLLDIVANEHKMFSLIKILFYVRDTASRRSFTS